MKFVAEVPASFRRDGIAWLVLWRDDNDTGGWFLDKHTDPMIASTFDSFYLSEEDARAEAREDWGVTAEIWMSIDQ